jgi:uncharacterized protein YbaP (TraB family)
MYYEILGSNVRLAGSLHRLPATAPSLPEWVTDAYTWSEELVFEADPSTALQHFWRAGGSSLESRLPAHVWHALNALWPKSGPLADLRRLKEWAALMTLSILLVPTADGVEPLLTARARQDGKPIRYLETMAEFSALAEQVPEGEYVRILSEALAALPEMEKSLLAMHDAWRSQDVTALAAILPKTLLGRSALVASIALERRNEMWLPKIMEARRADTKILVAVGALHLAGPSGLLSRLEAVGEKLRPLLPSRVP